MFMNAIMLLGMSLIVFFIYSFQNNSVKIRLCFQTIMSAKTLKRTTNINIHNLKQLLEI